jgi:hypothetical protein
MAFDIQAERERRKDEKRIKKMKARNEIREFEYYKIAFRNRTDGRFEEPPSLDFTEHRYGNTVVPEKFPDMEDAVTFIQNTNSKYRHRLYAIYGIRSNGHDQYLKSLRWRNGDWKVLLKDMFRTPATKYDVFMINDVGQQVRLGFRIVNYNFFKKYVEDQGDKSRTYVVEKDGQLFKTLQYRRVPTKQLSIIDGKRTYEETMIEKWAEV